jgi:hypothetical protein
MKKGRTVPSIGISVSKFNAMKDALKSSWSTINALQNGGNYKHTFKQTLKLIDKALK